ncbi:hypothetical protein ACFVSU_12530 [Microbacterium sp. NPDC058062]|uniref:hypothetical protein n=1 Tax=Microbacterium sp. NPDC058062 TaxID=3346320 RepID=UPI0036D9F86C
MTDEIEDLELETLTKKESVEFWQREVHYYERRAGEQGVMANRIVTLAVAFTAAIPVAWTALSTAQGFIQLLIAFGIPTVILLLLANAVRLLHEMERLRRYVQHAETELIRVADGDDALRSYRRWADIGGKKDMPVALTSLIVLLILAIGAVGVFSFVTVVATDVNPWSPVIYGIAVTLSLLLIAGLVTVYVHARAVGKKLDAARVVTSDPAANSVEREDPVA